MELRIVTRNTRRLLVATTLAASAAGAQGLAPRAARLDDATIARDLARLDAVGAARGASHRTRALAALAAEAYLQGEAGPLSDALLEAATRGTPLPRTRRAALWALVDSARTAGREDSLATAVEVALLRAQYPVLGAPRCAAWEGVADTLAAALRPRIGPVAPIRAPEAVPPIVASAIPAVTPPPATPVASPPAPRELRGIPSRVHFALDRATLAPASRRVLDVLADTLRRWPGIALTLEGHTDPRASASYNAMLSRRRAEAVRAHLVARGIVRDRIAIVALGKSRLDRSGDDVVSLARNRRVEFRFTAPDGTVIPAHEQLDDLQLEAPRQRRGAERR